MQPRISTEDVLTVMLYGLEMVMLPTRHKYGTSYEQWLYQNGWMHRLRYLEGQQWLQRERRADGWVCQLTATGRAQAKGGRDAEAWWQRPWDGWWRQIVFDLPVGPGHQRTRASLIRWLRRNGFGCLQDSVWISPDPVRELADALKGFRDDAASFTVLECRCAAGFSDAALVAAAWPFSKIRQGYQVYEEFADTVLKRLRQAPFAPRELFATLREERGLWLNTFTHDPLLPRSLWLAGYSGQHAWQKRQELLRHLAAQATSSQHHAPKS